MNTTYDRSESGRREGICRGRIKSEHHKKALRMMRLFAGGDVESSKSGDLLAKSIPAQIRNHALLAGFRQRIFVWTLHKAYIGGPMDNREG